MPSDIAIKITNAWFTHDIKEDVLPQEQMASILDSMGVGDAFEACRQVIEYQKDAEMGMDVLASSDSDLAIEASKDALRKAGMV